MTMELTYWYLPTALLLGALHALEPGHAKTLTASYLISIKGTVLDALFLGMAVAITHSILVIALAAVAIYASNELLTQTVTSTLEVTCAVAVIGIGGLMLLRRMRERKHACCHHDEHGHDHAMPDYAQRGERPSFGQIIAFGAVGGMVPCPASVSVMLLGLNAGKAGLGMLTVASFSVGLGAALVAVGVLVVAGFKSVKARRYDALAKRLPAISAAIVIASGVFALVKHSF